MASVITEGVRGVALTDGTEFYAGVVVSALDEEDLLQLVDPRTPSDLVEAVSA